MNSLRLLRTKKGATQKEVAESLGIDRTTYVKYENGNSEPDNKMLLKLANYYNTSIDYLLGNTSVDSISNPKTSDDIQIDDDIRRIQSSKNRMPPKDKKKMMQLIELSFEDYFSDDTE